MNTKNIKPVERAIVLTTIHKPSMEARQWAGRHGWHLIVVADLSTPDELWEDVPNCTYLTVADQVAMFPELSDAIGWKCIQRRMVGIAYAWHAGATLVASVDDDNMPHAGWEDGIIAGQEHTVDVIDTSLPIFEPLACAGGYPLWHRGFPLSLVPLERRYQLVTTRSKFVTIQAGLWNGDPDIDAICRAMYKPEAVTLQNRRAFTSDKPAPFNSQNTVLHRSVLRDWFCFPQVGRHDDIIGAYVACAYGHRPVFTGPSVTQLRVGHDLQTDLEKESYGYARMEGIVEGLLRDPESWRGSLPPRAAAAFEVYRQTLR